MVEQLWPGTLGGPRLRRHDRRNRVGSTTGLLASSFVIQMSTATYVRSDATVEVVQPDEGATLGEVLAVRPA